MSSSPQQHGQGVSSGPSAGDTPAPHLRDIERARWAEKSTAQFISGADFQEPKILPQFSTS